MPQGRPVEEETHEGVQAAIRAGIARNEFARQFKLSTSTVSKIAEDAGP